MRLLAILAAKNRSLLLALTLALVAVVTLLDYLTPPQLASFIFYALPIMLGAWCLGLRAGVAASLLSAVGWFVSDQLTNRAYSHPLQGYLNAVVHLGFFLIITSIMVALRRARLMQEELSEFLVHDLRTPLTSIRAALKGLPGEGEQAQQQRERLRVIGLNAVDRMTMLINTLLDVARLEDNAMPTTPAMLATRDLLQGATALVEPWATQADVTLAVAVDPAAERLWADADLTTRVLVNLLSNAVKYSPAGATVALAVTPEGENQVRFEVRDQGPGVPAAWVKRVFGKFEQVQARKAGAAVGSGLGLTFCRMAVEAQGGRIWMESQPDVRTSVYFLLPACDPREPDCAT